MPTPDVTRLRHFSMPAAPAWAALAALAIGLLGSSCQKMPLTAPSGTALTLVPATHVLAVNGETTITAVLIEGGQQGGTTGGVDAGTGTPVHNGTVVTFTTTLGRLEPAEVKTTAGRATVRLIGDGRSGTATITAFSGPANASVDVTVGAAAAAFIVLTASPQALPSTGGTSTVTARVEDQEGNGLSGLPVSFKTTRGNLAATTVTTDTKGAASTTLTTTQEATVTATTGGASAALSETVVVTIKPRTGVSITAPTSATVGVPAAFSVTPSANTIITNVEVDFGDGSAVANLGAISSATNISHPFRRSGVMTIIARATDSDGGTGTVSTQLAVSPLQLVLTQTTLGLTVTLAATPSVGAIIDRYEWDFGDGKTFTSTTSQVVHGYDSTGPRLVTVRAVPLGEGTPASAIVTVDPR